MCYPIDRSARMYSSQVFQAGPHWRQEESDGWELGHRVVGVWLVLAQKQNMAKDSMRPMNGILHTPSCVCE